LDELLPEVTASDVEGLWRDLLEHRDTRNNVACRAEELIGRVNAANPVVNGGLLDVHGLLQLHPDADTAMVTQRRDDWRARLAVFEADPSGWMREYFRSMLRDVADRHGVARAEAFGEKLVRSGEMTAVDVRDALGLC
jgi:hypothetical protein